MAIYQEIVQWSQNKPLFMRDALRRLVSNPSLTQTDIDELILILKKEVGYIGITISGIPINITDIPTQFNSSTSNIRLLAIENPININSLYNKAQLVFPKEGLTIVYGNNGSGKSSYARLLKKLCWSRHKNIDLKKNVYTRDMSTQSVNIKFEDAGTANTFIWNQGDTTHHSLNSIFLFDSSCAEIYLNNENNTEYKPIGIDVLEGLIPICKSIDAKLNSELQLLQTLKPSLDNIKYASTDLLKWYKNIENYSKNDINQKINYTQTFVDRKKDLSLQLKTNNPVQENQKITQKIQRFDTYRKQIETVEQKLSFDNIELCKKIKIEYINKKEAYNLAQITIKGNDPLSGVGSESWRLMWEAAKQFAISEVHPLTQTFPDSESNETCVLCQQSLSIESQERLLRFNRFVNDKTSNEYFAIEGKLKLVIKKLEEFNIPTSDTLQELISDIPTFQESFNEFSLQLNELKVPLLKFLTSEYKEEIANTSQLQILSTIIGEEINRLSVEINKNNQLAQSRGLLEKEFLELEVLEYLSTQLPTIIKYNQEFKFKEGINQCKSKINTTLISKKVGELMESNAIQLQQVEFLKHLNYLNKEIASKISITKTKTTDGVTHQKCSFNNINEPLNKILSEGEQKIVAIANFLSECTIGNATNTLIFDDPVTSLDQDFREAIANIIVKLSADRQIIVLTHDLFFLRLLIDTHKKEHSTDCNVLGVTKNKEVCGYTSDEIPYLAKNTQERINSIREVIGKIDSIQPTDQLLIETLLDSARKRFRMLIEKSVEELLANKSIERFSRNIHVKSGSLSSFVVVEHTDIQFLLSLFGKYSVTEHDGGSATTYQLPLQAEITSDLGEFGRWKNDFQSRLKAFKEEHNYK